MWKRKAIGVGRENRKQRLKKKITQSRQRAEKIN